MLGGGRGQQLWDFALNAVLPCCSRKQSKAALIQCSPTEEIFRLVLARRELFNPSGWNLIKLIKLWKAWLLQDKVLLVLNKPERLSRPQGLQLLGKS